MVMLFLALILLGRLSCRVPVAHVPPPPLIVEGADLGNPVRGRSGMVFILVVMSLWCVLGISRLAKPVPLQAYPQPKFSMRNLLLTMVQQANLLRVFFFGSRRLLGQWFLRYPVGGSSDDGWYSFLSMRHETSSGLLLWE